MTFREKVSKIWKDLDLKRKFLVSGSSQLFRSIRVIIYKTILRILINIKFRFQKFTFSSQYIKYWPTYHKIVVNVNKMFQVNTLVYVLHSQKLSF